MACVDVGALRAYLDDELDPSERAAVAAHLRACDDCRQALAYIFAEAAEVHDALDCLAPGPQEAVTPAAAMRAWRARAAARPRAGLWQRVQGGLQEMKEGIFGRVWRPAFAVVVVVAVAASLVFTPVGAAVGDWLSVFRAEKFAPVTIDPSAMSKANTPAKAAANMDPSQFGEFKVRTEPTHAEAANVAQAQKQVDFAVREVGKVPAGLNGKPTIYTNTPADVTFVFDLAKTKAALAQLGVNVNLPANLDGAAVRVYVPAGVQMLYAGPEAKTGAKGETGPTSGLMLLQSKSPTIEMPAALDTPQMRDLFFSLTGLPPELVDQLKAMSTSRDTVPVPVMKGDTSRQVSVDGVQGLLVTHRPQLAANGPEGSYVVWQKGGIVYALGGTVSENDLLAAANSLK